MCCGCRLLATWRLLRLLPLPDSVDADSSRSFCPPRLPCCCAQNDSNVHLLKLYESGLPAWAIVLPSYGLWYRPWLRRVVRVTC